MPEHVPWVDVTPVTVAAGTVPVTVVVSALDGPWLVTSTVNVPVVPATTEAPPEAAVRALSSLMTIEAEASASAPSAELASALC